jgi:hypothetical protein
VGTNQNTWSHRTKIIFCEIKIIFHPLGSLAGFPARVIVLWQENVGGTRNTSLAGDCYNCHSRKALVEWNEGRNVGLRAIFLIGQIVFFGYWSWISFLLWMWFLYVWDLKYVCQQYFTCIFFLGFIRYNKTFIALPSGNMILLGE